MLILPYYRFNIDNIILFYHTRTQIYFQRKNEEKRIKRRREKEALELQLCLEAEFADVTSGELDINNAVTIFRLASEKNQE